MRASKILAFWKSVGTSYRFDLFTMSIHTEASLESEALAGKHWWLYLPTLKAENGGMLTMQTTTFYQSTPELAPLMMLSVFLVFFVTVLAKILHCYR